MPVPNIQTYANLVAMLPDYAGRGDPRFAARVPDFIALGEARIFSSGKVLLRTKAMLAYVDLVIPAGSNFVAPPADFLQFSRVWTDANPRVEYMPLDELFALPPGGDPARYSVAGTFHYGQYAPASGPITVRATYYAHPGNLGTAPTGSSWLMVAAPNVYLYAALCEGMLWAKNMAKAGEWGTLMEDSIATLNSADEARMVGDGRLRQTGNLMG